MKETFRVGRNALARGMWTRSRAGPGGDEEPVLKGQRGEESEGPQGGHGPGRGARPHSLLHETGQGPGGPGCPGDGRNEQRQTILKTREGLGDSEKKMLSPTGVHFASSNSHITSFIYLLK